MYYSRSATKKNLLCHSSALMTGFLIILSQPANSADRLGLDGFSPNQVAIGSAVDNICRNGSIANGGSNHPDFQARCTEVIRTRANGHLIDNNQLQNLLGSVNSEQSASYQTNSTEMNSAKTSSLSNRMALIRGGRQKGGLRLSGVMLDSNGNPTLTNQLAQWKQSGNKAAAGDDNLDRLGVFINGNIGFGDRQTTINDAGYNLDTHGTMAGMDYRIGDHFLIGTAFSYDHARSGFLNNLGKTESDTYSGTIYGSFFTNNGFFVDGIFSGSHVDYASRRNIRYALPTKTIDTQTTGKTQGNEFNIALTSGFNFNFGGLTVTPQLRIDYTDSQVDALNEQEVSNNPDQTGWALHVDAQSFKSLQTAPGLQIAYAVNLPWAVILPMVRAEYIHEFENDARTITARFLGDTKNTAFNISTDRPDRDFIVFSAGLSAQFIHGISAFVNYDTIQAHSYAKNHNFTGGVRVNIPF